MSSNISEKSLINPYELLGVNINSCLKEVRKAYYNFAKICHPDKGGDKKDMYIVQQAYQYILERVKYRGENKSYEELQQEFDKFCQEQTKNKLPTFYEISSLNGDKYDTDNLEHNENNKNNFDIEEFNKKVKEYINNFSYIENTFSDNSDNLKDEDSDDSVLTPLSPLSPINY